MIAEVNKLSPPYRLYVGQLLKIPPGVPYYVVQAGDTLPDIARRFNVTTVDDKGPEVIQTVNELSSSAIEPGMRLIIPYAFTGDYGFIAYTSNHVKVIQSFLIQMNM